MNARDDALSEVLADAYLTLPLRDVCQAYLCGAISFQEFVQEVGNVPTETVLENLMSCRNE